MNEENSFFGKFENCHFTLMVVYSVTEVGLMLLQRVKDLMLEIFGPIIIMFNCDRIWGAFFIS